MDYTYGSKAPRPGFIPQNQHHHHHRHHHHHHHHHHHQLFFCPKKQLHHHHYHHHHHHHCHSHVCPNVASFAQTLEPASSSAFPNGLNVEASGYGDSVPQILQEQEDYGLEEEEEEEDEPVFVLTDEWRDFFAKSEAKRKLEKKQAKKGKK